MIDEWIVEDPERLDLIPDDAHLIVQIEGEEAFNGWAKQGMHEPARPGRPVVYAMIRLKPSFTLESLIQKHWEAVAEMELLERLIAHQR